MARYEAAAEPPGPPPTTIQSNSEPESGTAPVSIGSSQNLSLAIIPTQHTKHKRVVLKQQ